MLESPFSMRLSGTNENMPQGTHQFSLPGSYRRDSGPRPFLAERTGR